MRNYVQPGCVLSLLAPYLVLSGAGFQVGSIFAVASGDAANGAAVEGCVEGVFDLAKVEAQAWTVGQKVYWDDAAKLCTTDGTAGILIGTATEIAANPTTSGNVRLNGAAPSSAEGPQAAIVALTDSTGSSGTHDDTLADGLTATAPAAITNYVAHVAGAVPVTSNAATDLDSTAAALATLENEVTALRATVAACVTDLTVQNQNDSDITQKILEIRTALIAAGIIAA